VATLGNDRHHVDHRTEEKAYLLSADRLGMFGKCARNTDVDINEMIGKHVRLLISKTLLRLSTHDQAKA